MHELSHRYFETTDDGNFGVFVCLFDCCSNFQTFSLNDTVPIPNKDGSYGDRGSTAARKKGSSYGTVAARDLAAHKHGSLVDKDGPFGNAGSYQWFFDGLLLAILLAFVLFLISLMFCVRIAFNKEPEENNNGERWQGV